MSLPSPSQLLGAGNFFSWYPGQEKLLEQSLDWYQSPARFLGLSIPTGSGKSLDSLLLATLSEARTVILTSTKGLQQQYCLSPETRVLTDGLSWVPIASVSVGDALIGFDENGSISAHRKWQCGFVTAKSVIHRPCYRLTFSDGTTVTSSSEHQWLVAGGRRHGTMRFWRTTENLRVGGKFSSKVIRLLDVWGVDDSREAGYLAAAFDGEGHLVQRVAYRTLNGKRVANGIDVSLGFSQKDNGMLHAVEAVLQAKGFRYYRYDKDKDCCVRLSISHRAEMLRVLGQIRPIRLLSQFDPTFLGSIYDYKLCELVEKEYVGSQEVVAITTTTGTFIAEGLAAHNCRDAEPLGSVNVVGQNNFPCILVNNLTADEGPCHDGLPCAVREQCPYRVQIKKALDSKLVITNYAYWLAQTNFSSGLGDFGLMICDESHSVFGSMENYLTIYISRLDIQPIGLKFPEVSTDQWNVWRMWAEISTPMAADAANRVEQEIKQYRSRNQPVPSHVSRAYRTANNVHARLKRLSTVNEEWVIQKTYHGYRFVPKWVSNYSKHLFHDIPKVVLMSAILSHRSADYIGVPSNGSRAWIEMDSHFPPENTPIWHIPTARINYRMDDYGSTIWCSRIDQLIQRRLDRKGIVFTVSYDRAKMLLSRSRFKDIMFTHGTKDVVQVVEKFKKAPAPAVLVSPSVTTGYDFPMDISGHGVPQYIILGKVAYPDTSEIVTKARHEEDKDWTSYMAMETIVQSAGRMSRSSEDKCEVFCIDDSWKWFYPKFRALAPKWFQDRVRGSLETVPDPLV